MSPLLVEIGEDELSEFLFTEMPLLDERQRRVVAGAGMLGHSHLATTRIYAAVDIEALRQMALP